MLKGSYFEALILSELMHVGLGSRLAYQATNSEIKTSQSLSFGLHVSENVLQQVI